MGVLLVAGLVAVWRVFVVLMFVGGVLAGGRLMFLM